MIKKGIALVVILVLLSVSVVPSTGTDVVQSSISPLYDGKTLYVGGSGPNNYTRIQDAINNASNGDTVFVFNGTYYENLTVDKSICLVGENRNTTIIDRSDIGIGNVIDVTADFVNISGFTIRKSGIGWIEDSGIDCDTNYSIISDNYFINNYIGIEFSGIFNIISNNIFRECNNSPIWFMGSDNIISENMIFSHASFEFPVGWCGEIVAPTNCERTLIENNTLINVDGRWRSGISLRGENSDNTIIGNEVRGYDNSGIILINGVNNTISDNIILDCEWGISLDKCWKNIVSGNILENNDIGIGFYYICWGNNVSGNFIRNSSTWGIGIAHFSMLNNIYHNNLINNNINAYFFGFSLYNKWNGNYWGRTRILPKPIIGNFGFFIPSWVNFDWHPAKEPYDIGGMCE